MILIQIQNECVRALSTSELKGRDDAVATLHGDHLQRVESGVGRQRVEPPRVLLKILYHRRDRRRGRLGLRGGDALPPSVVIVANSLPPVAAFLPLRAVAAAPTPNRRRRLPPPPNSRRSPNRRRRCSGLSIFLRD